MTASALLNIVQDMTDCTLEQVNKNHELVMFRSPLHAANWHQIELPGQQSGLPVVAKICVASLLQLRTN